MIAFIATFALSRQGGRWPPTRLILAGVADNFASLIGAVSEHDTRAALAGRAGAVAWLVHCRARRVIRLH
jgi:ABC-type Fe3+-siderophore transport system permease subunit